MPSDPLPTIIRSRKFNQDNVDDILAVLKPYLGEATDFASYRDRPVEFARDVLGIELCDIQKNIVLSVQKNRNTVVEKGHSIGGTHAVASLVLWFMATRSPVKCVTSAPVFSQVQNQIWAEMRAAASRSSKPLPGTILDGQPLWKISGDSLAIGLSPRKASEKDVASLQGYHSSNLLVILDEAGGLTPALFNAAKSLVTGESNRLLCIGNPVAKEGPFYEATKDPSFVHLRYSSLDHPNVVEGREIYPGAVSRLWVIDQINTHCIPTDEGAPGTFEFESHWYLPNAVFTARVLGQPPDEKESQLIRLLWIETARNNEMLPKSSDMKILSLDVALHGSDDSVLFYRIGDVAQWARRFHGLDTNQLYQAVMTAYEEIGADRIFIDEVGVGGGITDLARNAGMPVEGVNGARQAMQKNRFANCRAEIWWIVREKLRKGEMSLYNVQQDNLLERDLTAPYYESDIYGRIMLEPKEKTKNRLGRSPDAGDALAISYAGYIPELEDNADLGGVDILTSESRWTGGDRTKSRWLVSGKKEHWSWKR